MARDLHDLTVLQRDENAASMPLETSEHAHEVLEICCQVCPGMSSLLSPRVGMYRRRYMLSPVATIFAIV